MCLPAIVNVQYSITNLVNRRAVEKYSWIQAHRSDPIGPGTELRRRFNGFYRVGRQRPVWYDAFYGYFEEVRDPWSTNATSLPTYQEALAQLAQRCGRIEASFASKMLATLDPSMAVLDRLVLGRLGLRLPASGTPNRLEETVTLYGELTSRLNDMLRCPTWRESERVFDKAFPANRLEQQLTSIKKLDLLLWASQ